MNHRPYEMAQGKKKRDQTSRGKLQAMLPDNALDDAEAESDRERAKLERIAADLNSDDEGAD